jgi:hypothetical protein
LLHVCAISTVFLEDAHILFMGCDLVGVRVSMVTLR